MPACDRRRDHLEIEIVDLQGEMRSVAQRRLAPIHPGELLRDELGKIGMSLNGLARALRVPMNRISAIVNGKRAITVDTTMRLGRYFDTSPPSSLDLQREWVDRSRASSPSHSRPLTSLRYHRPSRVLWLRRQVRWR